MNRILLVCASALAIMTATGADAQMVRFSGVSTTTEGLPNIPVGTPISFTFEPGSGLIDMLRAGRNWPLATRPPNFGFREVDIPRINVGGEDFALPTSNPNFQQFIDANGIGPDWGVQNLNYNVFSEGFIQPRRSNDDVFLTSAVAIGISTEDLYTKTFFDDEGEITSETNLIHFYDARLILELDRFAEHPVESFSRIGDTDVYIVSPNDRSGFSLSIESGYDVANPENFIFSSQILNGHFTRIEIGSLNFTGLVPESPFLPVGMGPNGSFLFEQSVVAGTPFFFDPPVSVGYDYAVGEGSPLITSAMFPSLLGDLDGFDIFELGEGGSLLFADVMGGQWVDFTSLSGYANGISGFSLRDINPALMIDPADPAAFVTGLTFATSGTVTLTQTPVTIEFPIPGTGAVPEPSSWAMMIAGFGLTGAAMRRRKRLVAA